MAAIKIIFGKYFKIILNDQLWRIVTNTSKTIKNICFETIYMFKGFNWRTTNMFSFVLNYVCSTKKI